MSQFPLHGLTFQNQGSDFDQVFVALHTFIMPAKIQMVTFYYFWKASWFQHYFINVFATLELFFENKLLIFLFSKHCMTFISHANLKDFFDLPFFPGNINTNSLDGTVNIRLYHRTEIFQNQFHCITAHSNIPAKRMT